MDKRKQKVINRKGYNKLWDWFGLSYASWVTLPRVLLHAMSDDWQLRFAKLMEEYEEEFPNTGHICDITQVSLKKDNKYIQSPEWLMNYRHPNTTKINECRKISIK